MLCAFLFCYLNVEIKNRRNKITAHSSVIASFILLLLVDYHSICLTIPVLPPLISLSLSPFLLHLCLSLLLSPPLPSLSLSLSLSPALLCLHRALCLSSSTSFSLLPGQGGDLTQVAGAAVAHRSRGGGAGGV